MHQPPAGQYGTPPGAPYAQQPGFPAQAPKNGMATAALVVGIVALLLCLIPFVNVVSIVGGLVAVVLGVLAMKKAKAGAPGKGMGVAGVVLGAISAVVALIVTVVAGMAIGAVSDEVNAAIEEAETELGTELATEPTDETAADDEAEAEEPAVEEPAAAAGMGEPVRDGQFEFTVTNIETGIASVGDDFLGQQAQGQFVLVHLTVTNIGDEARYFDGSSQTLVDSLGRKHSADTGAAIYLDDSNSFVNQINPGNTVDGVVVFDVPVDIAFDHIELHDSMFSGGVSVSLG